MFENLSEDNYVLYAVKAYNSPHCIMSEFESDFKRIKYLKRLFRRYKHAKNLKERLILNHLIMIYNVFERESATRLLFLKTDERDYPVLKTFLIYLSLMPDYIHGINGKDIRSSDIMIDMNVADVLRKI